MTNIVILDRTEMDENIKPSGSQGREPLIAPKLCFSGGPITLQLLFGCFAHFSFTFLAILSKQDTVFDGLLIQVQHHSHVLYSYALWYINCV